MAQSKRKTLGSVLLEMVWVLFAVLIGLWIANWDEDRKADQRAAESLRRVVTELEQNQQELAEIIPYYWNVIAATQEAIQSEGDLGIGSQTIAGWAGFKPPLLETGAYTVAIESDVLSHLDLEEAAAFARAYGKIERFEITVASAMGATMSGFDSTSTFLVTLIVLAEIGTEALSVIDETLCFLQPDDEGSTASVNEACPPTQDSGP